MPIENGRLSWARYTPARCSGGTIAPTLIVVHDTAGSLKKGSSVAWFQDSKCEVSAHFIIETDGSVVQMVPMDRRAFHCGQSEWHGKKLLNSCSIGIEMVNPGMLESNGKAYFDTTFPADQIKFMQTAEHGSGYWLPYTRQQLDAVKKLCREIVSEYPDVNEIVGHYQISPGRKIDPNPLFPFDEVRASALDGEGEYAHVGIQPAPEEEKTVSRDAPLADIIPMSRKMTWLERSRAAFGVNAGSFSFGAILYQFNIMKGELDAVMGFVRDNAVIVLGVAAIVCYCGTHIFLKWSYQDYKSGRWIPSGMDGDSK
jgi:N-acetylmuramoyl-L-alanine amidase